MISLYMLFFIIIASGINGSMLRLSCKHLAHFSETKQDVKLKNSAIQRIAANDIQECKEYCLFHENCKSVNFHNLGDEICELNSQAIKFGIQWSTEIVESKGWELAYIDLIHPMTGGLCEGENLCGSGNVCTETCDCPGYICHECKPNSSTLACTMRQTWTDCSSLRRSGKTLSGVYLLKSELPLSGTFFAYCDLSTDDYGWLVFQRRIDNSTNFDRGWKDYKRGFGDLQKNFWLGLDRINIQTAITRKTKLRIELKFSSQPSYLRFAEYETFSIGSESTNYKLTISEYDVTSTLPNAMVFEDWGREKEHNGMMFSAKDNDHDVDSVSNCAEKCKGGWWFNDCHSAYLNGLFTDFSTNVDCFKSDVNMNWDGVTNCREKVIYSEMKIRSIQ